MSVANINIKNIGRIFSRVIHTSSQFRGSDSRDHRVGHIRKRDLLEGEKISIVSEQSYELVDDNLMNKVIDDMKFKDLPQLHITCTRNNTKLVVTDGQGKSMISKSAGTEGYKNCRKGTTVAAQAVANRILTFIKDHEMNSFRLVFNGLGPGRNAAYKMIENSGIKIVSLSDRSDACEPWSKRPRAAKSI